MDSGFFQKIEPLVKAGRLKEAAAALKKIDRAKVDPWEFYLWAGRIEESGGRLDKAEASYRKALEANPLSGAPHREFAGFLERLNRLEDAESRLLRALELDGPSRETHLALGRLYVRMKRAKEAEAQFRKAAKADPKSSIPLFELAQFLEKARRFKEAQKALQEAAAKAPGEPAVLPVGAPGDSREGADGGRFYTLMDINSYRQAFLAEASGDKKVFARVETAMKAVLKADPLSACARVLLVEILITKGKYDQAEREMAKALLPRCEGADTSLVEVLLKLIDLGRFGRLLENALLSRIREGIISDKLRSDWPQIFSALVCVRKYEPAFRLGEAMLEKTGWSDSSQGLMWPWWRKVGRAVTEQSFCEGEVRHLRCVEKPGGLAHWFAYCRAILLSNMGKDEEAMAEYGAIKDLDEDRYAWMRQWFGMIMLSALMDTDGAIEIFQGILKRAPGHWWIRCRMAEAYLIKGSRARALKEFEKAESAAGAAVKREVMVWSGEVLLWLGEYAKALEKFDGAIRLGAETFVHCWRGAAYLKLGDYGKALADLDLALSLDPKDFEVYLWRGEARRLMGRNKEALQDLDAFVAVRADNIWARFNRALASKALGDEAGAAADFNAANDFVRKCVLKKLGVQEDPSLSVAKMCEVMTAGLELAKGIRRWELYVNSLWIGFDACLKESAKGRPVRL